MTPKEKADNLFTTFAFKGAETKQIAIECALIVVDEVIESRKDDKHFDDRDFAKSSDYFTPHPMGLTYWKEVEQELTKQQEQ
jgi:hypothetical protein